MNAYKFYTTATLGAVGKRIQTTGWSKLATLYAEMCPQGLGLILEDKEQWP